MDLDGEKKFVNILIKDIANIEKTTQEVHARLNLDEDREEGEEELSALKKKVQEFKELAVKHYKDKDVMKIVQEIGLYEVIGGGFDGILSQLDTLKKTKEYNTKIYEENVKKIIDALARIINK